MKKLPPPWEDLTEADVENAIADFAPLYALICEAAEVGRRLTQAEWDAVQEGQRRIHARDALLVRRGVIKASDLHIIPAEWARRSKLLLTPAATTHFKVRK